MRILKTAIIAGLLTLTSTSAFAGTQADTTIVKSNMTQVQTVKAPVLLEAGYYAPKTVKRRVTRVQVNPVQTPVAREASTSDHGPFVYKFGKNTKTKTFRPAAPKSAAMPNLFK